MLTANPKIPEQKRVTITSQRRITIPEKFFREPGCPRKAICAMKEGMLIIQPEPDVSDGGECAAQILSELISEGFSGQDLLDEFRRRQAKVRPAIEALLEAARAAAAGSGAYETYEDIFGG